MLKKSISGTLEPMLFSEFLDLMNLSFKLFGRSYTTKKFDKYKHQFYTEDTDGRLVVKRNLSYIETPLEYED